MVEVAQKLQFINEYEELETVKTGYWAEVFGKTAEKALGEGGQ